MLCRQDDHVGTAALLRVATESLKEYAFVQLHRRGFFRTLHVAARHDDQSLAGRQIGAWSFVVYNNSSSGFVLFALLFLLVLNKLFAPSKLCRGNDLPRLYLLHLFACSSNLFRLLNLDWLLASSL